MWWQSLCSSCIAWDQQSHCITIIIGCSEAREQSCLWVSLWLQFSLAVSSHFVTEGFFADIKITDQRPEILLQMVKFWLELMPPICRMSCSYSSCTTLDWNVMFFEILLGWDRHRRYDQYHLYLCLVLISLQTLILPSDVVSLRSAGLVVSQIGCQDSTRWNQRAVLIFWYPGHSIKCCTLLVRLVAVQMAPPVSQLP